MFIFNRLIRIKIIEILILHINEKQSVGIYIENIKLDSILTELEFDNSTLKKKKKKPCIFSAIQ